jgi:uncharacterized protein YaaN involved in tellurite resistance
MIDDKLEKEIQLYINWIHSLELGGVIITDLFNDLKDGLILIKILQEVLQMEIDGSKIEKKPNNRYKMLSNLNLVINTLKQRPQIKLIGVGSSDLIEGTDKNKLLGLLW